jgi:hypothetical protein
VTGPRLVVRLVVSDLGEVWAVEGTWDAQGRVGTEALRSAARWLMDEADEWERGAERAEASTA